MTVSTYIWLLQDLQEQPVPREATEIKVPKESKAQKVPSDLLVFLDHREILVRMVMPVIQELKELQGSMEPMEPMD